MNSKIAKTLKNHHLGKLKSSSLLTNGYANENYRIETEKGIFLYRICKQQSIADIQNEINFLQILKKNKFPAAYPIARTDNGYICKSGDYPVIIYDFIKGEIPELNEKTVSEIGKAVAKLNLLKGAETFTNNYPIDIKVATELINQFSMAKYAYPQIFSDYAEAMHYLKNRINVDLPKGFIHADIFRDNTIFEGDKLLAVIDFENFSVDILLFDVAMTINGFCFIDNQLNLSLLQLFLVAYQSVRVLSEDEKKQLPDYILWAAVGMSAWHLKNDMLNTKNDKQTARVQELLNRYKETKKLNLQFR